MMDYLDLRQQGGSYVEAIKDGEIIRVPESVAILEDLFILRKISSTAEASVQTFTAPFLSSVKSNKEVVKSSNVMYDWKHGKFSGKKNNVVQDLIPNFNWEISRNRKIKNMSRLKLAQLINSTEEEVKMIELGELPADDFVLISRIEQVFGINLRKHPASVAGVNLADLQKRGDERKKDSMKGLFKNSNPFSGAEIEVLDN